MKTKIEITTEGPILPGSISTAKSRCGKRNCACKAKPPKLHGVYYRWTGIIAGKRTTKTINRETALECKIRIVRFRNLQRQIDKISADAIVNAPWVEMRELENNS